MKESIDIKRRNSNFELLRIICILLILSMHVYSQAKNAIEANSANYFLGTLIGSVGNIGVTCFILISGYFGVKLKWNRFLQLIILTTLYSVLLYFCNKNITTDSNILQSLLVIPLYKNWFITCYLVLMLLSPYLNSFIETYTKRNLERLLITLFIMFSVLPTLFNTPYYTVITDGGKCLTYFIFIYFIGRYLRMYLNINVKRKKTVAVFLLMTFVIYSLNTVVAIILKKPCSIYAMDCSPFILISAISIFYLFKSFSFQYKLINYISSSILAVYLLDGLRLFLDYHIFKLSSHANSNNLIVYLFLEIILTFSIATCIDKVRIVLFSKWEDRTINFMITKTKTIKNRIAKQN